MAADRNKNEKRPSNEMIQKVGRSINECWNKLQTPPIFDFPPIMVGEICSPMWHKTYEETTEITHTKDVILEETHDDLDIILNKSINQSMKEAKNKPVATVLWCDDGHGNGLWYENELAVLFGRTNTGKSMYAVQIAEHIAKNLRKKVLYIDLEMSMKQFQQRYTSENGVLHEWPELLIRPEMEELHWALNSPEECLNLLKKMLDKTGSKILMLDNLTFLVNNGGMKPEDVKTICSTLCDWAKAGYSILVINHTPKIPPFTPLDINHCLGSSMLTNFVQSVFAIGTDSNNPSSGRYVKQLKSRNGRIVWDANHVLPYIIDKTADPTMLQFIQSCTLHLTSPSPAPLQTTRESEILRDGENVRIKQIRDYHTQGLSIREIARQLGMSPTTVSKKVGNLKDTEHEDSIDNAEGE